MKREREKSEKDRKTVLVPLDGSPLADVVVPHVEPLLRRDPYDVILLRVLPPTIGYAPGEAQAEREAALAHLTGVRRRLETLGVTVATHVRRGPASSDPASELLAAMSEVRPDLVAMCSHGHGGLLRWLRGSVADAVLRGATAPLLLVTARSVQQGVVPRMRRVLVPLDGGERSAKVLPLVEDLAARNDAEVVLARVEWEGLARPPLATALRPEAVAESLRPWRERLEQAGVRVRVVALSGDPAAGILDVAAVEDCDLVAMTTHGRSGFERWVEGSVTEKVLRHCDRPLLVVRAEA